MIDPPSLDTRAVRDIYRFPWESMLPWPGLSRRHISLWLWR
jgi:hypothetical protein